MFVNGYAVPVMGGVHIVNTNFQGTPLGAVPGGLGDAALPADVLGNIQTMYQENKERVLAAAAVAIVVGGMYATNQINGSTLMLITLGGALLGLASKPVSPAANTTNAVVVDAVAVNAVPVAVQALLTEHQLAHMNEVNRMLLGDDFLPHGMRTRHAPENDERSRRIYDNGTNRYASLSTQNRSNVLATRDVRSTSESTNRASSVLPNLLPETLDSASTEENIQTNIHNASTCNAGSVFSCMAKTLAVGVGGVLYGAPLIATVAIVLGGYLPAVACIGVGAGLGYAIDSLCGNGGALGQLFNEFFYGIKAETKANTPYAAIAIGALTGIIPLIASSTLLVSIAGIPRLILAGVSFAGAGLIITGVEDKKCFETLGLLILAANIDVALYLQASKK